VLSFIVVNLHRSYSKERDISQGTRQSVCISDEPIVQVVVVCLRADRSFRGVRRVIVLPEDIHEAAAGTQLASRDNLENRKMNLVVIIERS
jgi:hypothetical protein